MEYYLYILYSESIDQFYVGITHDVEQRLYYHNLGNKGWTRRGRPWRVVFQKAFPDREHAAEAEKYLKKQKSKKIIQKIIAGEMNL